MKTKVDKTHAELLEGAIDNANGGELVKYPDREAWLRSRAERLGSSDVSNIFGVGFGSEYDTWRRYAHPDTIEEDSPGDAWENEPMEWGTRMQSAVLEGAADRERWAAIEWPQTWRVNHPTLALACTPDAIACDIDGPDNDPFLVEIKFLSLFAAKSWPIGPDGEREVAPKYQIQAQVQMACTGLRRGYFAMVFGGNRLEVVPFEYHEGFQEVLADAVNEFWKSVEGGYPPEVDGSEATRQAIRLMYPEDDGATAALPPELDAVAEELALTTSTRKAIEEKEQELKNRLTVAIGDATYGATPAGRVFSWKEQEKRTVDAKRLREEFPEVYAAVEKTSRFRVLRSLKKLPKDAPDPELLDAPKRKLLTASAILDYPADSRETD